MAEAGHESGSYKPLRLCMGFMTTCRNQTFSLPRMLSDLDGPFLFQRRRPAPMTSQEPSRLGFCIEADFIAWTFWIDVAFSADLDDP